MSKQKKQSQEKFAFTKENLEKVKKNIAKYPEGREKSAVKSLLDLAQRQNGGWLNHSAIECVADILNLAYIRVFEIATFYNMFSLKPVGKYHLQVCTTTPCMLRNSDDVIAACKKFANIEEGEVSSDGNFSIKEVECLGACANAPVVQINDDYFEDLDADSITTILEKLKAGEKVKAGSQIGRKYSEPFGIKNVFESED